MLAVARLFGITTIQEMSAFQRGNYDGLLRSVAGTNDTTHTCATGGMIRLVGVCTGYPEIVEDPVTTEGFREDVWLVRPSWGHPVRMG